MSERKFKIWRGDKNGGEFVTYYINTEEGMVVLDAIRKIQITQAPELAIRWNCKAGKCGSCAMEINGLPRLSCMTKLHEFNSEQTILVQPLKAFPVIKDLVTDLSWNYEQNKKILPFEIAEPNEDGKHIMYQHDVERVQEFRKCIECFLCQDVCHVLRDHQKKEKFVGPRFMHRLANLAMHPLDTRDRIEDIKNLGSGMCNITKCCVEVCPEHINTTDNAIIPLKERVIDRYYDPVMWIIRKLNLKKGKKNGSIAGK
jgi:succinate dehydrogenase / fumarate reductase iron-sulfur subunit